MDVSFEHLPTMVAELLHRMERLETQLNSVGERTEIEVKDLISIEEAGQLVGLAKPTIYSLTSQQKIPFMKKGKKLYFSRKEIDQWIRAGKKSQVNDVDPVNLALNRAKRK